MRLNRHQLCRFRTPQTVGVLLLILLYYTTGVRVRLRESPHRTFIVLFFYSSIGLYCSCRQSVGAGVRPVSPQFAPATVIAHRVTQHPRRSPTFVGFCLPTLVPCARRNRQYLTEESTVLESRRRRVYFAESRHNATTIKSSDESSNKNSNDVSLAANLYVPLRLLSRGPYLLKYVCFRTALYHHL